MEETLRFSGERPLGHTIQVDYRKTIKKITRYQEKLSQAELSRLQNHRSLHIVLGIIRAEIPMKEQYR